MGCFFALAFCSIFALSVLDMKVGKQDYGLFAAKTTYDNALEFLNDTRKRDSLPNSFGHNKLEAEHASLMKDGCEPVVFYYVSRHAARFPDVNAIRKYNRDLSGLVERLRLEAKKSVLKKRVAFLNWRSRMVKEQGDLVTELGGREQRAIAHRFKRLYPKFFDSQTADIKVATTDKIRTAQTGAQFAREINGLEWPGCDENSLPTNDIDNRNYNLNSIIRAPCYDFMLKNFNTPILNFHKECKKIGGGVKIKDKRIDRIRDSSMKWRIANRVAAKLGLDNDCEDPHVTPEVLESIFGMCKFETALNTNGSIWCDLFEKTDIEVLEYIEDFSSYIKAAYGPYANPKQACPVVKDLLEALDEGSQITNKVKAYFNFSHADPIKKLLASFGLFKDDDFVSEASMSDFEQHQKVQRSRSWRTSLISPFSANIAFILYRCSANSNTRNQATFKLLTTVTEQPVLPDGCRDIKCNSEDFFSTYNSMRNCDLNEICKPRK